MPWFQEQSSQITREQLQQLMERTVAEARQRICDKPRRVLLLPPDITRMHSGAGMLTEMLYNLLCDEADVHVIPTLGQHVPHTPEENRRMFGSIPNDKIHAHDWRDGSIRVGELSAEFINDISGGAADWPMPFYLNRSLVTEPWDLIINVGQGCASRSARICQSQQKLLHRPRRQRADLCLAHDGGELWH